MVYLSRYIRLLVFGSCYLSQNPMRSTSEHIGLGSSPFARRYLGNRGFFLFLRYLDVSVPWFAFLAAILFTARCLAFYQTGFHSDISGSMAICASPQLFAACHVLLRLLVPRHSPYALISLTLAKLYYYNFFLSLCSFQRTKYADDHRSPF